MTRPNGHQAPSVERDTESTAEDPHGQRAIQPWIKLWPKDWSGDLRLRTVSLQARGTFWSLFLLMHQGEGTLRVGGQPPTDVQLAALLCCDVSDLRRSLDELLGSGLVQRARDGSLESPELLRQMRLSATRAAASLSRNRNENPSTTARSEILLKQNSAAKRGSGSGSGSREARERTTTPARELIGYFSQKYQENYREPFPVKWGRDTKAVNEMLRFAGGEMAAVQRKIDLAFASDWHRDRGLSLVKISSAWSSLHDPKTLGAAKRHPEHQAARAWWDHVWRATRGIDPVVTPDDERALDAILERLGGFQQARVRIAHVLESEDPITRQWASLPFLARHLDQFATPSPRKE